MADPAKDDPGSEENPIVVEITGDADALNDAVAEASDKLKPTPAYVAVDALSWRPHPLPRGTEVSGILPADVIEARLADGSLSRERPS